MSEDSPAGTHTEADITRIFDQIRAASYGDISDGTQLVIKDFADVGMSTPWKKVYINLTELNKYSWPEDVVRGAVAHELAHQVQYQRRSFVGRYVWLWNYVFSRAKKRRVENEADLIAMERGYREEIVRARIYQFNHNDPKRAEREKKIYLPIETLEKLIRESGP